MKIWEKIAFVLVLIGGLNWGLVGIFNFNLVNAILSNINTIGATLAKVVYAIVGISAVALGWTQRKLIMR